VVEIKDIDDPLLDAYRDIRNRNWTYVSKRFIAEGPLLVERLLASQYPTESVLLDRKWAEQYLPTIPEHVQVLLLEHHLIEQLVGFHFHRGVLACGIRPARLKLQDDFGDAPDAHETIVATVGVQDPENLGSILRCCSGFGIRRVILGPETADPLSRRVLRVSMGQLLNLRLLHSQNILADLQFLHQRYSFTSIATSLQDGAQSIEKVGRNGPIVILVGNERYGLPEAVQAAASQRVRIDMELGTDSLNVSIAAAIVMHYFCRIAKPT
jgi:tRNA G18 (ribose-2'-O)-methylase SpoU